MQDTYRTEQESDGARSFMVGMLCGAVIGAALGLMFAPKPGAEMRQQWSDRTHKWRRQASEQADRLRRRASSAYSGASETVNDVVARGRDAFDAGREAFQKSRPDGASGRATTSMP